MEQLPESIIIRQDPQAGRAMRVWLLSQDLDRLCKEWPKARKRWATGKGNIGKEAVELAQQFSNAASRLRDVLVEDALS